jgi:ribosome modulation factor
MSEANPKIGRIGAFRARREGVKAALDGQSAAVCPYKIMGDYEERVKARYWMRGWARANVAMERLRVRQQR